MLNMFDNSIDVVTALFVWAIGAFIIQSIGKQLNLNPKRVLALYV